MTDHRSPKVHRDPPTRPAPWLDPDPLTVEPEPIDQRVPRHDPWERARDRLAGRRRTGCSVFVLVALLLVASSILAAPRPAPHPTVVVPRDLSGLLADASDPVQGGAPHGPMVTDGDPLLPAAASAVRPAPQPRAEAPVPSPSGEVGTALIGGYATWYDTCPRCAAAGPALRSALGPLWRGTVVTVEGPAGAAVTVTLSDWCGCGERHGLPTLLDLSRTAFAELAHPSAGIVAVSIEIPARLPATDMEAPR